MSLTVSKDAEFLNRVINDPSVFPWISLGMEGPFDVSDVMARDTTVFLADEYGGFLFVECGPAMYEVHTQFLPGGRGPAVLRKAKEAVAYMFRHTPCIAIRTFVSDGNEPARKLTLAVGFEDIGAGEVFGKAGRNYLLTIKGWVCH